MKDRCLWHVAFFAGAGRVGSPCRGQGGGRRAGAVFGECGGVGGGRGASRGVPCRGAMNE